MYLSSYLLNNSKKHPTLVALKNWVSSTALPNVPIWRVSSFVFRVCMLQFLETRMEGVVSHPIPPALCSYSAPWKSWLLGGPGFHLTPPASAVPPLHLCCSFIMYHNSNLCLMSTLPFSVIPVFVVRCYNCPHAHSILKNSTRLYGQADIDCAGCIPLLLRRTCVSLQYY